MKILLTGASSFTGMWFARELAVAGHEVTATFTRDLDAYDGLRRKRVEQVIACARGVHGVRFGDGTFLSMVSEEGPWDLLCHHAADVTDYRSPDFDVAAAVENNTRNLRVVLAALAEGGCRRVVLTGSVFEPHEGAGEREQGVLKAFSPYGLSKGLAAEMFRYYAAEAGLHLGKFVIPNPFGPYEEPRFTAYLMRTWFAGDTAQVKTPAYVRDNIHVSLLSRAYVTFAESLPAGAGFSRLNPCGYVESQGAFAQRFAAEMRSRLDLACGLELLEQTEFAEPRMRVNTDPLDAAALAWNEARAWDELAKYYREHHAGQMVPA